MTKHDRLPLLVKGFFFDFFFEKFRFNFVFFLGPGFEFFPVPEPFSSSISSTIHDLNMQ